MPVVSAFYGLIISLYYRDNKRHHKPHIHVWYQDSEAVLSVPEGELIEGSLPNSKMKLVLAWMEIHKDELLADWKLAADGQQIFKIDPLK
ncbi:DUF4160 domain-containing protein [Candidatus Electronema sp. JC]|uniref:DUF4160 domain-containing protein n=1 Tax=Candidatus Electronema sp. JC TaxID=3401570 RepID=UPI003B4394E1